MEYLKELFQYSHPNTLSLTQGFQYAPFFDKEFGLAFIWSGMIGLVDLNSMHPLYKKIQILPFPIYTQNQNPILHYGGFNIRIPNNIKKEKIKSTWDFLIIFKSSESFKEIHALGGICTPRFSIINDPDIANHTKITKEISNYSQNHKLKNWMRPSIINIELIYSVLSDEIQEYLNNNISAKFVVIN